MNAITQLLSALNQGDPHAASRLLPLVYEELRKLAAQRMAQEQPGQTLLPTALAPVNNHSPSVNEDNGSRQTGGVRRRV
jgi:hypothetical protein